MIVYLDLIWLLNLGIDFLLISGTALLLKRKKNYVRIGMASLVASIVVFFMFTPYVTFFMNPIVKFFYSCMIVFIAFGYIRFTYFVQNLAGFFFLTFVTGGGLFAMHYFFQSELDLTSHLPGFGGSTISWTFVLIGFPLVYWFSKQQVDTFKIKKVQANDLATVEIVIDDFRFETRGLVDTGNQLKDPLTRTPVMIMEADLLHPLLGKQQTDDMLTMSTKENHPFMHRIRLVPFKAVGQKQPYLTAFKPDQVTIYYDGEQFVTKRVLLGLYGEALSPEGHYQTIIHPQLVISQVS
ncbi:sigma-E processing peptidase SpoIIGA [Shouchella miscanthi]|uniref:Sporulation sigma-E factor-processing peptidase n=1 Tax=Shouchella miscanthi TaxID=2598861 RepID=A0ABU6NJH6_9BACI|nr:sigma-E processing peptidase SpoIIGA [Shouchella miscanthi]MED4127380.1 sigma-E processing peptidase SpoIIGA [Shouchella miscanthi]